MDAAAELALQRAAGGRADGLDHLPAGAHDDALLRLALHPDQRAYDDLVRTRPLELLDEHLHRVWQLMKGPPDGGLAHQLRDQQLRRLVAGAALMEEKRRLGHLSGQMLEQSLHACTGTSRDRK